MSTKNEIVLRLKMRHDPRFLKLCLLRLYEKQDEDEQETDTTKHSNAVGWNRTDAMILTPIARNMVLHAIDHECPFVEVPITHDEQQECLARLHKYTGQLLQLLTGEELL